MIRRNASTRTLIRALLTPKTILSIFSVAVFIISVNLFWGYKSVVVSNSIDGSWQYTLSDMRHSSQTLGVDVFFNYGPLFEQSASYISPHDTFDTFVKTNLLLGLIVVLCAVGIVRFIYLWVPNNKKSYFYGLFTIIYVFLTVNQPDMVFVLAALSGLLACLKEKRLWLKLLILFGLQLLSLYKFNYAFFLFVLSPLVFITSLRLKSLGRSALEWLLCVFLFVAGYMLVTGQVSLGFFKFFYYGTVNAIYYNEFMSLPLSLHTSVVVSFAVALALVAVPLLILIARRIWSKANRPSLITIFAYLFMTSAVAIIYKGAVVRSDGHLMAMLPVMFLPVVGILLLFEHQSLFGTKIGGWLKTHTWPTAALLGAAFIVLLTANSFVTAKFSLIMPSQVIPAQLSQIGFSLQYNRLNYSYFNNQVAATQKNIRTRGPQLEDINAQLKNLPYKSKTILFYGNTTMLGSLLDKQYVVKYMPYAQTYAAHPPQLFDNIYIDFFKKNPDALVFVEETEASVNERLPANELNGFFQYLRHNYKVVIANAQRRQFVLEPIGSQTATCQTKVVKAGRLEEKLDIPKINVAPNEYVNMHLSFAPDPIEDALGVAVKKPLYQLQFYVRDDLSGLARTTRTILEHGISVNPMYFSYYDTYANTPVPLQSIAIHSELKKHKSYEASFDVCKF